MPKYESFHLRYDGGQRAVHGGTYGLVEHLEPFGSGLPTDAVWRNGGPLLVGGPNKTQQILAWIRGIPAEEVKREGAWQAWGVIGPTGGFGSWMTFWDALSAAPERERLDALASAFERGDDGPAYPPMPQRLASLLADLYTAEVPYRIALRTPSELALLPWCCLLGPVEAQDATIGPPRRMRLNLNVPMTYDVSIADTSLTDQQRTNIASSPLLLDIVARAQRGDVDGAVDAVWPLRNAKAADRRKRIFAPLPASQPPAAKERALVQTPVADETSEPVIEATIEPFADRVQRWGAAWTPILVAMILLLQLAEFAPRILRRIAAPPANIAATDTTDSMATDTSATDTTSAAITPATATVPAISCNNWWTTPETQAQVIDRLRQRLQATPVVPQSTAAALLAGTWNERVAAALAMQLQVNESRCAGIVLPLDGSAGQRTMAAARSSNCASVRTDLSGALQWLCESSAPQS